MNRILYSVVVMLALTSCAEQFAESYNIQGSSSVSVLDGSKLYLKALKSGEVRNIDSCDVIHGEFHFAGLLDSVRMANLFMDDESIMPVVLEEGEILINIGPTGPSVGGTPLLGVGGAVIKAHGNSRSDAIVSAIGQCLKFIDTHVNEAIEQSLKAGKDQKNEQ